jgi:hypothetical protein
MADATFVVSGTLYATTNNRFAGVASLLVLEPAPTLILSFRIICELGQCDTAHYYNTHLE